MPQSEKVMPELIELTPDSIQQVAKTFISEIKKKRKEYILYYSQNLPQTFTISSNIVRHDEKKLDIRQREVKNTVVNIDTVNDKPLISSESPIDVEKKYYRVPTFLPVKNGQRLNRVFDEAYAKVLASKKPQNQAELVYLHEKALDAGIEALHKYANWVVSQNKMLVEKYPDHFFYQNPNEEKEQAETVEKLNKSTLQSVKKWVKSVFSGKGK